MRSGLNGDSAWLLHVAGRVLDGGRLYVDVVEVNPPLVVWLNLPVVALARAAGVSEPWAYRGLLWAAMLLSLLLSDRMLRRLAPPPEPWRRHALLVALVVLFAGLPGPYFGQREHLALILTVPWLVLCGVRFGGTAPPAGAAAVIGVLAGLAVALKPHYLVLPAAVYGFSYLTRRPALRRPTADLVAMGAVLAGYASLVALAAPEYLAFARKLGGVYWDYLRRPVAVLLFADLLPLTVIAALLFWPIARQLAAHRRLVDVLGISTAALFAAVVLQHKGFGYHYYPALGTGLLLVFLGVLGGGARLQSAPLGVAVHGVGLLLLLPALALFAGATVARAAGSARQGTVAAGSREIGAFLEGRRPRGAVVVYSPWMDDSFPMVLEHGVTWGSRYPFVWFLPALYRDRLETPGTVTCRSEREMSEVERELIGTVAADLAERRPELVFVRKTGGEGLLRVPILNCLARLGRFRREFAAYRPVLDLEHFRVFQRGAL